ncbi:helix-turn-helix domain-containing protein [Puniceibacterium sediminis]|nr:helix-turn-helix domain-containing protein [Puniceibacterium sediminis]
MTCRNFSTTECGIAKKREFTGSVRSWRSGALGFGDVAAKSADRHLSLVRSASDIRMDPRDHIMVFLSLKGKLGMKQSDRSTVLGPGDVALYDQAAPFTLDFIGDSRGLVMAVERSFVTTRLEGVADLTARRISGQSHAGKFTQSLLSRFQDFENEGDADISAKMESSVLDLIFGSVEHCFRPDCSQSNDHRDKQLRKIKDYLLGNLQDTNLNLDMICGIHGVSPRSLNRLFSAEGTTPMRWLWKMRLQGAYRAITEGRSGSITDIAFDFGFSDASHFSQAFKREFGRSPSSILLRS